MSDLVQSMIASSEPARIVDIAAMPDIQGSQARFRVSVRDTGRGVQLENRERVFEQYFHRKAGTQSLRNVD